MKRGFKKIEFVLAIIIAVLLVGTLLSQEFLNLPYQIVSFLILAFVVVKLIDIIRSGGTIFEDYTSLAIIIIFGVIHFVLGEKINSIMITTIVFILAYSVGLVPWINDIIRSRKITSFILSYVFFVVMIVLLFAGMYALNDDKFFYNNVQQTISFEDAIYFSAITFTTVGYGDIAPVGINKLITSLQAILGMVLNIVFIGYILASKRFRR